MRKGGGHSKGSEFERQISKDLSKWMSRGESVDLFWRTAGSGARATTLAKKGIRARNQAGDVASVDSSVSHFTERFYIECKFYKRIDLDKAIYSQTGTLVSFWSKCCRESRRERKVPLLVVKQNLSPILLCTTQSVHLELDGHIKLRAIWYPKGIRPMYIYHWKDFLEIDPDVFAGNN